MVLYFLLFILILFILLLLGFKLAKGLKSNNKQTNIVRVFYFIIIVIGVMLAIFLISHGRVLPAMGILLSVIAIYHAVFLSSSSKQNDPDISIVRSKWLEMKLDHTTDTLNGTIVFGKLAGTELDELTAKELLYLYGDLSGDNESVSLLEAYLDRRVPGWRERTDSNFDPGRGSSAGSGSMTDEEAYQVLGLEPGATPDEIRAAYRRLVKAVHPDGGGSTYLTARINQAKDTLLN